ncbi:hypothetical protein CTheo_7445 [Ceratobasidium theobromae]|uniref:Uncharacterized protein n=1 Tax=Ceratobasidium theobromae TaxID=1582974 RepID=A0A5N5QCF7_9AGAM|nr:hypothetical protein CTheo_7445 [Ceratobasidium theobromae]
MDERLLVKWESTSNDDDAKLAVRAARFGVSTAEGSTLVGSKEEKRKNREARFGPLDTKDILPIIVKQPVRTTNPKEILSKSRATIESHVYKVDLPSARRWHHTSAYIVVDPLESGEPTAPGASS